MKALILAAGRGSRMDDHSETLNKCMLRIGDRPIIEYSLIRLARIESISEIVIVVGYQAEAIINFFGISFRGKRIKYVIQKELRGLVNAIECASIALEGEDFFLILGDEILSGTDYEVFINEFNAKGGLALIGVTPVEDKNLIRKTYTLLHDEHGKVLRLIEKPEYPLNNLMGTGHVLFGNNILSFIDKTPVNPRRNEKDLPELMQTAIDFGQILHYSIIAKKYSNVNAINDLVLAEAMHMQSDNHNHVTDSYLIDSPDISMIKKPDAIESIPANS
jgi:UDP-N-acetylglucosamine diphosphorylase / glucose-1-phosphate thymidylyltransferase / UDP-N-acetylgalactosamine diphosphorylase / glucosamine-1-phosphate N-acetyltransferase / galactosamine-1-phosphate N-acetyltransferase